MNWLRAILLTYAAIVLLGAYLVIEGHHGLLLGFYLVINGAIIAFGVIFERGRYKPKVSSDQSWETTKERFQDATTGKWMVVRYNRRTGERDYVESETRANIKD